MSNIIVQGAKRKRARKKAAITAPFGQIVRCSRRQKTAS